MLNHHKRKRSNTKASLELIFEVSRKTPSNLLCCFDMYLTLKEFKSNSYKEEESYIRNEIYSKQT